MSQQTAINAEDIEYLQQKSDRLPPLAYSTDRIISSYESKINQSIASKSFAASKIGETPKFTEEELLYLNRNLPQDDTELKVITPLPSVTLKKGKTELNIDHAVKLVQKMEEKYPTSSTDRLTFVPETKEIFVTSDDVTDSLSIPITSPPSQNIEPMLPQDIRTVNKNAYEIREAVLAHALDWMKYVEKYRALNHKPTEDDVLNVANKFYKFVENRR